MPTRTRTQATYTPTSAVSLPAEATFTAEVAPGARGARVRFVQEWLCLHGVHLAIDGGYGPATATGVRDFRRQRGLPAGDHVDRATFEALVQPMRDALAPLPLRVATLGQTVVACAQQHLAQHPREVGGQNMGPWVRLYMDGNQGAAWPWCSGFATLVLRQAAHALGVPVPVVRTFSCDVLAGSATSNGCFVSGTTPGAREITPGSLFLVRRTRNDWEHVGIVTAVEGDVFRTIEGNTNDAGHREGYEVCARVRAFDRKDFVLIA